MNANRSQCLGIADLRQLEGQQLYLLDLNGGVIESQRLRSVSNNPRSHAALKAVLAQCFHHPCAVALIVNGEGPLVLRPECISFDPVPVFLVTEAVAAARAVPDSWEKFQLINVYARTLWLLEKRENEIISATCASWDRLPGEVSASISHFAAVGFENVAVLGDATDFPNTHTLSNGDVVRGARESLKERLVNEGVGLSWNRTGREVLSVVALRKVGYDLVHTHRPVFSCNEPALADLAAGRPVLFVVDRKIDHVYGEAIHEYSSRMMNPSGKLLFDAAEIRKNVVAVARICKDAARLDFPRHGIFVAVGGGVTLDVVGLAASVYRRGIGYLRVPTTLVGLVDAGVGIKQGVNFLGRKNLIGAFYPPIGAVHDIRFLTTLPLREISCGLAEIIKIAFVKDSSLFDLLEEHGRALYQSRFSAPVEPARQVLLRSALLMLEELQPNLFEENLRRPVDFGHTFSPVIESQSRYAVPHGHAVALDMLLSTAIAVNRGLCPTEALTRLSLLLQDVHLPLTPLRRSIEHLTRGLWSAKQHRAGNLNLVVPTQIGKVAFLQEVSRVEIEEALNLVSAASGQTSLQHADASL